MQRVALGGWFNYYMSESFQSVDSGVVAYQHCQINEGHKRKDRGRIYASQEATQILKPALMVS